jgi:basic membrane protein A
MRSEIDAARDAIIAGELAVHDYSTDDSCPALTF